MHIIEALGRIFLSTLFLFEAVRKFFYQEETIEYMESFGVPEILFYPSLFFEFILLAKSIAVPEGASFF